MASAHTLPRASRASTLLGCLSRVLFTLLIVASLLPLAGAQSDNSTASSNSTVANNATSKCDCGFFDPVHQRVYSDSIILYFNETNTSLPTDVFSIDSFQNPYEKGWSIFYREGAAPQNVFFSQGNVWNLAPSWLSMNVTAATPEHLVNGSQLQTLRQDILYGSFRVFMRSPQPYAGGSALTMKLAYNETSSAELDLMNQDDSQDDACMVAVVGGQGPFPSNTMNYTKLEEKEYNIGPWDFWEWRMDWNADTIDWYAGANKTMTNSTANATLVDLPASFTLKHWSNGNKNWMQGPPTNNSGAAIGWVRLFFNSSIQTTSKLNDPSCTADKLCSTDDWTLRVTTDYSPDAKIKWMPASDDDDDDDDDDISSIGLVLLATSGCFSVALVLHALLTRAKSPLQRRPKMPRSPMASSEQIPKGGAQAWTSQADVELDMIRPSTAVSATTFGQQSTLHRTTRSISERPLMQPNSRPVTPETIRDTYDAVPATVTPSLDWKQMEAVSQELRPKLDGPKKSDPGAPPATAVPQARTRVDYLAGMVAVCSILVSMTHFILTFVPSVIEEYLPQHYESEYWARRTIEPFFFNEIWVGLFLTTSTRFLTTGYLRTGNLKTIAEKIVCRCPRLMIPITAVILFEYFLIDLGAVKFLEYIPSITWSTWPSVSLYPNFAWFLDETLQLIYLIPNAAPQITQHFCTGVLWTIPVQYQFSFVVLLGVVLIREIKTPWKRFGYYAFCIINNWYAMSWGSYFWFGLMLADLDITYKYRKWIQARAHVHYPMLIFASLLVFFSLANDLFSIWTGYTFGTNERSIHPEVQSAKPIGQTSLAGYPEYTEPKLNGLLFAVGAQYVVELSTWVQAVLSTKIFLWYFPHVFTTYLIHGLIFWSIGSLVCVYFAGLFLPFWLNILLTALICYATLFASLPIITPIMEFFGKEITKSIWSSASEEPAPWKPSSFPLNIEEIREMVRRKDDELPNDSVQMTTDRK